MYAFTILAAFALLLAPARPAAPQCWTVIPDIDYLEPPLASPGQVVWVHGLDYQPEGLYITYALREGQLIKVRAEFYREDLVAFTAPVDLPNTSGLISVNTCGGQSTKPAAFAIGAALLAAAER